jgi:hypothetical protein
MYRRRLKLDVNGIAYMNVDAGKQNDRSRITLFPETADSIESAASIQAVTVYPNPVRDQLNIQIQTGNRFDIQLIRMDGSVAKQFNANASNGVISLPVRGLTPGSYVLQLTGDDGKVESSKIVVE